MLPEELDKFLKRLFTQARQAITLQKERDAALGELTRLRAQVEWMPISGAPKDGSMVLVLCPFTEVWEYPRHFVARNFATHPRCRDEWTAPGWGELEPTHYRLLPAPPVEGEK